MRKIQIKTQKPSQQLKKLVQEFNKRNKPAVDVLADAPSFQREFIEDKARLKAILATRRASKSYTAGLYLFDQALKHPGVTCLYIALTRGSADRIMSKDVLKVINQKYNLGAKFNATTLTVALPNGSLIYLMGMDSSDSEREKALGQKYKLIIVDECASFRQNLRDIINSTLRPAMVDLDGTICMIGTPGNNTKSYFYDVTTDKEPEWKVWKWKALDNPFVASNLKAEIDRMKMDNPLIVETPLFQQMYLGLWVTDTDKLVYKFNAERNVISSLPPLKGIKNEWEYLIAVDPGYEDDTAIIVAAYNQHDPVLYIVEEFSQAHMDVTAMAEKVKEIASKYPYINKYIVDGASKQAVIEMRNRHGIPFISAEKSGKLEFIEIMNGDLITEKVKVLESVTKLQDEWQTLIWDERSEKKKEHSACSNHLCDAVLYCWRYAHNYRAENYAEKRPLTGKELEEELEEQAERNYVGQKSEDWWDKI